MAIGAILVIILILLLIGGLPTRPYGSRWGYFPSGGFGIALVAVTVLLMTGSL